MSSADIKNMVQVRSRPGFASETRWRSRKRQTADLPSADSPGPETQKKDTALTELFGQLSSARVPSDDWRLLLTVRTIHDQEYDADYLIHDRLSKLLEAGLIDAAIAERCAGSLLEFMNRKFLRCFPSDAFSCIESLQVLAPLLSVRAPLGNRYEEFLDSLGFDGLVDETARQINENFRPEGVSALAAQEHFRYQPRDAYPNKRDIVSKASELLFDLLVTAGQSPPTDCTALLRRALSVFRLLGYLHKHQEATHFDCSEEYDVFCTIGLSKGKLRRIRKDCAAEPLELHAPDLRIKVNKKIGFKRSPFGPRSIP